MTTGITETEQKILDYQELNPDLTLLQAMTELFEEREDFDGFVDFIETVEFSPGFLHELMRDGAYLNLVESDIPENIMDFT